MHRDMGMPRSYLLKGYIVSGLTLFEARWFIRELFAYPRRTPEEWKAYAIEQC